MKIAHITWSFTIGGAESMLVDIVNEQSKKHAVALIIVNSLVNPHLLAKISSRVTVITINRKPGSKNILDIVRLNIHLLKLKPDVVHCHSWNLVKLLWLSRCRKVLTLHIRLHTPNAGLLDPDDRCLIKYDRIFAISNAVANEITKEYNGIMPVVVYNGIDFSEIDSRKEYHYDTFTMVQVSRLDCKQKAQDILLKALHSVVYHYGIKNVHLDVIGDGASGDYLKAMAKELKLNSYCSFLGSCPREFIYANLKNYNLLVQPSTFEGFGLTAVEGMAAKIPVLTSNIEGPMEIIQNGKFGYFFEIGNPEDCAKKIVEIMVEYRKYGLEENIDRVYRYALERFDIKRTAADYIAHYQKLM